MAVIVCTACDTELTIHCGNVQCNWLRCRNQACDAQMYDVRTGTQLLRDGHTERLGGQ